MPKKKDFTKMKTTTLIDLYESADDTELMEIYEELTKRSIFECLNEDIREREKEIESLSTELSELKSRLKNHQHLPDGKAVEEL